MNRAALITDVSERLGSRRLVWAGLRGSDAEPLADLPQFSASFSIISTLPGRGSIDSLTFEDLYGERPDLEVWDIEDHRDSDATKEFRTALLNTLARPSALLPYRSSQFISAIWFARKDSALNLGRFGGFQSAFEHKPWVEVEIAALGVPNVPWTYVADEEQLLAAHLFEEGPILLRRSRTSGGEGFVRINEVGEIERQWPMVAEGIVSVAHYLSGAIPINIGAVVWHDGVTIHSPSVQLVGCPDLTQRPFGYCGNDFELASRLDSSTLDEIDHSTRVIGNWLHDHGYRGAFGVDYLLHEGRVLFTEINPRFQGSTYASCYLSIQRDESCLMLEHIAALLGVPAPRSAPLREQVKRGSLLSNIVVHWQGHQSAMIDGAVLGDRVRSQPECIRADAITRRELITHPGAVIGRFAIESSVTADGATIDERWAALVRDCNGAAEPEVVVL